MLYYLRSSRIDIFLGSYTIRLPKLTNLIDGIKRNKIEVNRHKCKHINKSVCLHLICSVCNIINIYKRYDLINCKYFNSKYFIYEHNLYSITCSKLYNFSYYI